MARRQCHVRLVLHQRAKHAITLVIMATSELTLRIIAQRLTWKIPLQAYQCKLELPNSSPTWRTWVYPRQILGLPRYPRVDTVWVGVDHAATTVFAPLFPGIHMPMSTPLSTPVAIPCDYEGLQRSDHRCSYAACEVFRLRTPLRFACAYTAAYK
jgi:hypothetical protein